MLATYDGHSLKFVKFIVLREGLGSVVPLGGAVTVRK
jgi:hypothetical protein